jgi:hypothetical protein
MAGAEASVARPTGALQAKGLEVHVANSREAVRLYNELAPTTPSLAAAIHLTC